MTMTFYDCKTAPSPRRARIILAEKNADYETVQIDLYKGEQMGEAFAAINPNKTVPALKLEDGTVLTENAGIAAYLEARFPTPALLGVSALDKAHIAAWNSKVEMALLMSIANALRNANSAMVNRALPGPNNYAQIPALAQRGLLQVDHFWDMFETHLEGREFVAADQFSIADITAAVAMDFSKVVGKRPPESHVNIARWRAGLAKRDSFNM